ncbi:MAG: hypothetical protein LBR34_00745 [Prevotella sp.]|nr:hypothetical protein [Prevotella sp.]
MKILLLSLLSLLLFAVRLRAEQIAAIDDLKITTADGASLESADFIFLNALPNLAKLDLSDVPVAKGITNGKSLSESGLPERIYIQKINKQK